MSAPIAEKIFHPTAEKLQFLLASIHNREMALPDFQRDFVWDPSATEELIESICQHFPAGSLLRIKNSNHSFFAPREVAGAPQLNGHKPSYLILDGQQRMTSLYQAFYGVGTHRYFIEIGSLIAGKDLEDCVWHDRAKICQNRYGKPDQQAANLTFPFSRLFGEDDGFDEWMDEMLDLRPETDEEKKELKRKMREVKTTYIKPVLDYEFPMVTLAENTTPEAVCTIFETLNRTGVKLSVFDLLAARFWPEDVRIRENWLKALEDFPIIAEFDVDPYYVLQSISLFSAKAAPSCKRSDVLKMDVSQIKAGWQPVIKGLADGLHILRDECGVILPHWLPYNTIVVTLAAICAHADGITGPEAAAKRNRIIRWFWCSVFGQTYENSPNSQAAKDYIELVKWLDTGLIPKGILEFNFEPALLRQTTPRQRAVYRGVICLILRNEARDFHTGKRITVKLIEEEKIDDHHIFPQGYIATDLSGVTNTLRDCVLNRTLIDKTTNIHIGKRAPSDYLQEIQQALGADFEKLLSSHLLPSGSESPLLKNNFEEYLNSREKLLGQKIKEVTS
jgi:hypothetical protein